MWALALGDEFRHDYGGGNPPISTCGHRGTGRIDFNSVNVPKCKECLLMWPSYDNKKGRNKCNVASVAVL